MRRMRLIQVGLGVWGYNWAKEALPPVETVDVVAHVDVSEAARERVRATLGVPASKLFASLGEALAAVECDAVLASLPTAWHVPISRLALESGKHVIVEKPFAPTLAEAVELTLLAEARGLFLMVSQNYRHYPAAVAAANLVAEGSLGPVQSVEIDFRRDASGDSHPYPDLPDPLLADMAIHHFDLLRMVLDDEPLQIACRTWNPAASPLRNHAAATFWAEFKKGTIVSYRGSWVSRGPKTPWAGEWAMELEQGAVFWTGRGDQGARLATDRLAIRRPGGEIEPQMLPPLPYIDRSGTTAALAHAVLTGTAPPRFSSGRDNIGSLALVEAAILSARHGGTPVKLADVLPPGWAA